jgi:hypothetical protein
METWRKVWRNGISPLLPTTGLEALRQALVADDCRLIQGGTTSPPPLWCVQDWPVEAACPFCFCGWQAEGLQTVGEVEEFFARVCFDVDQALDEPAAVRWFINYFDEQPREEVRRELLAEVNRTLDERRKAEETP